MKRVSVFAGVLICLLYLSMVSASPHVFSHHIGSRLMAAFFLLALTGALSEFRVFAETKALGKALRVLDAAFPYLLFLGVASFSFTILNERLYSPVPEAHSIYGGAFTIGGLIPFSDSYNYMEGILNFLKYGEMNGQANYRPLAQLYSSVVYRLSGDDMVRYFRLSTLLLVFAICLHGLVVARHMGRFAAMVSVWALCGFFAMFQATFLNELPGGIVGTAALSLLLHGYLGRSMKAYIAGMCLFTLAMHMRFGVLFLLPAFAVLGGVRFGGLFRRRWFAVLAFSVILAGTYVTPGLQFKLFRHEVRSTNNFGEYALRIYRDTDKWPFLKEFPRMMRNGRYENVDEWMARVSPEVRKLLLRNLGTFVKNYFSTVARYSMKPERFLVPWNDVVDTRQSLLLLVLFLTGFLLHGKGSRERLMHWILLCYLACCFLAIPVMDLLKLRAYAASVSFNTLFFAVALHNGLVLLLRLIGFIVGEGIPLSTGTEPGVGSGRSDSMDAFTNRSMYLPALLFILILIGPLAIDLFRAEVRPDPSYAERWHKEHGTKMEVVLMKDIPSVRLETERDYPVEDPYVMPESKWKGDWPPEDTLGGSFHWIPATNMLDFGVDKIISRSLIIPDSLLKGIDIADLDTLVVLRDSTALSPRLTTFHLVRKVLHVASSSEK